METFESRLIRNIIQIRISQNLTKREMAERLNINETSYGRIESGATGLSCKHLADIASAFHVSVVDLITFPDKWGKMEEDATQHNEPIEAVLQIKLQKSKKDQVLRLIFGDNDIELLNH